MAFALTWLPEVLRAAGLKVIEEPGWQNRGHEEMGKVQFIICHHTASHIGTPTDNEIEVVTHGRHDLAGPLCNLFLSRDGTFYIIAAGMAYHAGKGIWHGITRGNSQSIGIEADNDGIGETWPEEQMDAYARGCAAILKHIGAEAIMCCGHKEYCLPEKRKIDPSFDMVAFRRRIQTHL